MVYDPRSLPAAKPKRITERLGPECASGPLQRTTTTRSAKGLKHNLDGELTKVLTMRDEMAKRKYRGGSSSLSWGRRCSDHGAIIYALTTKGAPLGLSTCIKGTPRFPNGVASAKMNKGKQRVIRYTCRIIGMRYCSPRVTVACNEV